jgi:hypothetical protein
MTWVGAILVGSLLLPSCGDGAGEDPDEPPPVSVRSGDRSFDLSAWAYCFGDVCADGHPPDAPPDIGTSEAVIVQFPLEGWSFTATFVPAGGDCERAERVRLRRNGLGLSVLEPVGRADTYDVTLFGRGDGDLVVTFRWTTPRDGPPGNLRSLSQPCQDAA